MKIYTLTLSPAIDVTYAIGGEIKPGLNRAQSFALTAGGKGINVARAIVRESERCGVEADVRAVFPAGGVTGEMLSSILTGEGLPCERVRTEADCRVNVSAIPTSGEDIEINARGAAITAAELCLIEEKLEPAVSGDIVAICGSCPAGVSTDYPAKLIRKLRERGVICVLDCDGEALRCAVASDVPPDFIKPNKPELIELCKSLGIQYGGGEVARFTKNKTVTVATYGALGVSLSTADGDIRVSCVPVNPVRIKGAGDTLLGAFLYHKFVLREADEAALAAAVAVAGEYVSGK